MGQRRKSRELLLQLLFQAETNNENDHRILLDNFWSDFPSAPEISERTEKLYLDISQKKRELDTLIEKYSHNWKISRMSSIDRNVLRAAIYELYYCDDVPGEVVLDEAIEIAKRFGNENSSSFVNGILDKIWKDKSTHDHPTA